MLGEQLKKLRKTKNMKQKEFATYLNVTTGAVGLWEINRRSPDCDMLIKIAEYFNVSIEYLLGKTNPNEITLVDSNGIVSKCKISPANMLNVHEMLANLSDN